MMTEPAPPGLLDVLFSTEKMRILVSDRSRLQAMLDFESALARAEGATGVIPQSAVQAIVSHCRADEFDAEALARGTALGGNVAIPMVKMLTAAVAAADADAAKYVHWGATSQDAIDTGLVLQLRAILDVFDADLTRLSGTLVAACVAHRGTTLVGRTWLQQATPVTLGLKAAGWLSAIERHRTRLVDLRSRLLVVQFGGAVGTLAALGDRGLDVMDALARELGLGVPDVPWHTHRDRIAEVATALGLLTGTLGKIARDVSLLMQTEVGEAFEPSAPGKGGSSTLPHKRNPVGSAVILGAAMRVPALVSIMLAAMVQEHERGMGNWHAEWETLPEIASLASGALAQTIQIVDGLEVDAERMARNLDLTHGLILAEAVTMALGAKIGRQAAHQLVEGACRDAVARKAHLRDVLYANDVVMQHLSKDDVAHLLDPAHYTGQSAALVDRAVAAASRSAEPRMPPPTSLDSDAVRLRSAR